LKIKFQCGNNILLKSTKYPYQQKRDLTLIQIDKPLSI